MNKILPYGSKPEQNGYYRLWAEGAPPDKPLVLHVCVERDEYREVDIEWGRSFKAEPHKLSELMGRFEGPHRLKDLV
jgi:hypothetical protein